MAIDKKRIYSILRIVLIAIAVVIVACNQIVSYVDDLQNGSANNQNLPSGNDYLLLTMLDVGQGDCFLLESGAKKAMVDCGPPESADSIISYLNEQNISKLDYLFITHPHDDHGGGAEKVLDNIEVGTVVISDVSANVASWYIKLLEKISHENIDVDFADVGNRYYLDETSIEVIGPISKSSSNLNNSSIVLRVSFGEMDVLMMGDAETPVEKELIKSGAWLEAEILKLGHHGSDTSTSKNFLISVDPMYALFSCKVGNKYHHPSQKTMDLLHEKNIPVYRTDECGTVVAKITSNSVEFSTAPGDYLTGEELEAKQND